MKLCPFELPAMLCETMPCFGKAIGWYVVKLPFVAQFCIYFSRHNQVSANSAHFRNALFFVNQEAG